MNNIFAIAKNTFKETVRDKILITVTLLGSLFMLFCFFAATISLDQGRRIVLDFGLAGILLFGIIISILVGANLLTKEVVGGTALLIFPKPLTRGQYIIGKFFGLALMILASTLTLLIIFVIGFYIQNKAWPNSIFFLAVGSSFLEILIIIALSIMFGSFSQPTSSALFTLALFITGHSYSMVLAAAQKAGNAVAIFLAKTIYYLLPNLEKFNLRTLAVYNIAVSSTEYLWIFLYALVYIALCLFVATAALKKREF